MRRETFLSFDDNPPKKVRAVIPDTSKAFDKVSYEGLIFKMKCNDILGDILGSWIIVIKEPY